MRLEPKQVNARNCMPGENRGGDPLILDGARLASARADGLAARAELVAARRGFPPRLALIAFAGVAGTAPYAARKARAGAALGVEVKPLIIPAGTATSGAEQAIAALLAEAPCDGVFVEFPFPEGIDEAALIALIPEVADIDVMTPGRTQRFLEGIDTVPPLTVSAGLELLDGYGVDIRGLAGLVIGEPNPFTEMFREALARQGAVMSDIVPPEAPDLNLRLQHAELVVVSAARQGLIRSDELARGAVVIDVGYFNAGGQGDVDISAGIDHLAALAPVPGGIGPMTISVLLERLIECAEEAGTGSGVVDR